VVPVVTLDIRVVTAFDSNRDRIGVIGAASIHPFIWNILLSARNEGLGGVLTTFLAAGEKSTGYFNPTRALRRCSDIFARKTNETIIKTPSASGEIIHHH
jgi:hypothetical protein